MGRVHPPIVETWINEAASEAEAKSRFGPTRQAATNTLRWLFTLSRPACVGLLVEGVYIRTDAKCSLSCEKRP